MAFAVRGETSKHRRGFGANVRGIGREEKLERPRARAANRRDTVRVVPLAPFRVRQRVRVRRFFVVGGALRDGDGGAEPDDADEPRAASPTRRDVAPSSTDTNRRRRLRRRRIDRAERDVGRGRERGRRRGRRSRREGSRGGQERARRRSATDGRRRARSPEEPKRREDQTFAQRRVFRAPGRRGVAREVEQSPHRRGDAAYALRTALGGLDFSRRFETGRVRTRRRRVRVRVARRSADVHVDPGESREIIAKERVHVERVVGEKRRDAVDVVEVRVVEVQPRRRRQISERRAIVDERPEPETETAAETAEAARAERAPPRRLANARV